MPSFREEEGKKKKRMEWITNDKSNFQGPNVNTNEM